MKKIVEGQKYVVGQARKYSTDLHVQVKSDQVIVPGEGSTGVGDYGHGGNRSYGYAFNIPYDTISKPCLEAIDNAEASKERKFESMAGTGKLYFRVYLRMGTRNITVLVKAGRIKTKFTYQIDEGSESLRNFLKAEMK